MPCPAESVAGDTVRQALEAYFSRHRDVLPYVLDEQGHLRRHLVIFIDGEQARDRQGLGDRLAAESEVYVMQALSGG